MTASDIATMESSWSIANLNTSEGRSISFQHDTNRSSTEFAEHSDLEFENLPELFAAEIQNLILH
jgi:hypothetical protein